MSTDSGDQNAFKTNQAVGLSIKERIAQMQAQQAQVHQLNPSAQPQQPQSFNYEKLIVRRSVGLSNPPLNIPPENNVDNSPTPSTASSSRNKQAPPVPAPRSSTTNSSSVEQQAPKPYTTSTLKVSSTSTANAPPKPVVFGKTVVTTSPSGTHTIGSVSSDSRPYHTVHGTGTSNKPSLNQVFGTGPLETSNPITTPRSATANTVTAQLPSPPKISTSPPRTSTASKNPPPPPPLPSSSTTTQSNLSPSASSPTLLTPSTTGVQNGSSVDLLNAPRRVNRKPLPSPTSSGLPAPILPSEKPPLEVQQSIAAAHLSKPHSLNGMVYNTSNSNLASPSVRHSVIPSQFGVNEENFVIYQPVRQIKDEDGTDSKKNTKQKRDFSETEQLQHDEFQRIYSEASEETIRAAKLLQKYVRRWKAKKVFKRMAKWADHRVNVAKEILSTEETYVNGLRYLRDHYMKTFRDEATKPNPLITKQEVSKIFSDIEVILGFNEVLLNRLKERIDTFSNQKTPLSDVFLDLAPFFKTYTRYCNNYDKAVDCLKEKRTNEEFKSLVSRLDKDPSNIGKLTIQSYLILPIQRIPRYRLLLQDFIAHTENGHFDKAKLEEALTKIKEVADHLNAQMKTIDTTNEVLKLQEQFSGLDFKLIEPHRKFVKEGLFNSADGTKVAIHLFNDILIYSRKKSGGYDFRGKITNSNAVLYDSLNSQDLSFQIRSVGITLTLLTQNVEEKSTWMTLLYDTFTTAESLNVNTMKIDASTIGDDSASTLSVALASAAGKQKISLTNDYCLKKLLKGATLLKYCRNSKPHFRKFILSSDMKKLSWGSPNKNMTEATVNLKEVKHLITGQRTAIFSRYKSQELEPVSFSLLYRDRTLDIVCKDEKEFTTWVQGLTYLISDEARRLINSGTLLIDESSTLSDDESDPRSSNNTNEDSSGGSSNSSDVVSNFRIEKKKFKEQFEKIGDLYSWGQGASGALGHGDQQDVYEPLVMKDFLYLDVETAECENAAAAAITTSGELFTWGNNSKGRLGHGDEGDRLLPSLVRNFQDIKVKKVCMGSTFTFILDENGVVWGFGGNEHGQLGLGVNSDKQVQPVVIPSLKGLKIEEMNTGSNHTAAVTDDGKLLTWGKGEDGELGHNDKTSRNTPTIVNTLYQTRVVEVALGLWHTLALTADGKVYSFGNSMYGQLGHGNTETALYPKEIVALSKHKVVQIAAGSTHSGCITNTGELYMWGNGIYGQIGNNKKEHSFVPCKVTSINEPVIQMSCGSNHTLILTKSGKVYAYGAGTYGRLGLKSESDQAAPKQIPLFADKSVRLIVAGGSTSFAVCAHQWVPDNDKTECMNCNAKFTFFNRRHHCRNCGGLFCNSCTTKRIALLRFGFNEPVRVCDICYSILSKVKV